MTNYITRLYATPKAAKSAADTLIKLGFRKADVTVITARDDEKKAALRDRLVAARVSDEAAAPYAEHIKTGHAALVVRADYTPLGARRIARETLAKTDPVSVGDVSEDTYVKEKPQAPGVPTVLSDHPKFFQIDRDPGTGREPGLISEMLGLRLLSDKPRRNSTSSEGGPITTRFIPMKLLSDRPRKKSVIEGGGTVFSDAVGWRKVISRG